MLRDIIKDSETEYIKYTDEIETESGEGKI